MRHRSFALLGIAAALIASGCSSSEESGGTRSTHPQRTAGAPPQSVQKVPMTPAGTRDSATTARITRKAPRVRSSQDTVRASTARRSRPAPKTTPLVRPPNAMYSVQVGAFRLASNALALQRKTKTKAGSNPVFNNFFGSDKLYRVSVGRFDTRRAANAVRTRLMKSDSLTFRECWVTYIKR